MLHLSVAICTHDALANSTSEISLMLSAYGQHGACGRVSCKDMQPCECLTCLTINLSYNLSNDHALHIVHVHKWWERHHSVNRHGAPEVHV